MRRRDPVWSTASYAEMDSDKIWHSQKIQVRLSVLFNRKIQSKWVYIRNKGGLISKWQGLSSSKIINDYPGVHVSAYLIDTPLFNASLAHLMANSAAQFYSNSNLLFLSILAVSVF